MGSDAARDVAAAFAVGDCAYVPTTFRPDRNAAPVYGLAAPRSSAAACGVSSPGSRCPSNPNRSRPYREQGLGLPDLPTTFLFDSNVAPRPVAEGDVDWALPEIEEIAAG